MKKIVIIGGLGYIGTELSRLYSGFSWEYEVVVIDKRFISRRVNELKNWKIKFIQSEIKRKKGVDISNGILKKILEY